MFEYKKRFWKLLTNNHYQYKNIPKQKMLLRNLRQGQYKQSILNRNQRSEKRTNAYTIAYNKLFDLVND